MDSNEILGKIGHLESEIRKIIRDDNGCECIFEITDGKHRTYTFNNTHKTVFLLYEEKLAIYDDKILERFEALEGTLKYIKDTKSSKDFSSWTVEWLHNEKKYKSYFYATDLEDLAKKFYINKNKFDYKIVSVKVNPIS
jgi:hypothetical protein